MRIHPSDLGMRLIALVAIACTGGCAVGPDYVRPPLNLPTRYTAEALEGERPATDDRIARDERAERLVGDLDIPAEWWRAFGSAPLDALVRASLANNPNVEAARAALVAARANVRVEQAAFAPTIGASFAPTRQRIPDALASPASTNATYYNLYTAQVSVSYVPDVFGATRRQVEAAQAQADVQRFQLEATYLTLSSNVVVAALTEAGLRAQRDATLRIIAEQREILASDRRQQALGELSEADVTAQEAALASSEASLPPLDKQLAQQRNALATLAGRYPSEGFEARFDLETFELPAELPSTLPSMLVDHRPDIRAAEAQLQAASAGIGVAVAARLPNVVLGVDAYGSSAFALSQLFSASSIFWTLAASVTQPLFDGGALKYREAIARANFDQAAAQYRATVLSAFQDVANSLQAIDADTRALRATAAAERAAAKNLERTRLQVTLGDASPLSLLIAQQNQQQALLNLVAARTMRLTDAAALFQSLGGGWWNRTDGETTATASPRGNR